MDFLNELAGSTAYTFHSHTEFCDGRATMEAFARQAVAEGFTHYGFTPHSPVPIMSPCNMHRDNVARYFAEVERIKRDHPQCRFYAGMEVDYLDGICTPQDAYFQSLPLDYMRSSVHFVRSQDGEWVDTDGRFESFRRKMDEKFHGDIMYVVREFFEASHRMLDLGGFDILGHFDKIRLNASYYHPGIEDTGFYRSLADDFTDHIIDVASKRQLTVEINTKHYREHGCIFPAERHVERLLKAGVPMVVNSDAHVPALIDASRAYGLSLISK